MVEPDALRRCRTSHHQTQGKNMIDLDALGITKEELQDRIVDKAVDTLLGHYEEYDPEEDETVLRDQAFERRVNDSIKERIDTLFAEYAEKHIGPVIAERVANFTIQQTNLYGEKTGESVTLTEYLVKFAQDWMLEDVDSSGKTREQAGYNFSKAGNRISYAIDKHLHFYIEKAMKELINDGGNILGESIGSAVKTQLEKVTKRLKVKIETK